VKKKRGKRFSGFGLVLFIFAESEKNHWPKLFVNSFPLNLWISNWLSVCLARGRTKPKAETQGAEIKRLPVIAAAGV